MTARCRLRTWVIVPAAGGGVRFGAGLPKQYADLAGAPLLSRTLDRLAALDTEAIVVALSPDDTYFDRVIGPRRNVEALRCGGATRAATVRNALRALALRCDDDDWMLIHDAARPCVPRESLARLVRELAGDAVGGLLALPLADTLKRAAATDGAPRVLRTEDRSRLWLAQTPQMFRCGLLRAAYSSKVAEDSTDDARAIEMHAATGACAMPRLVEGSAMNIKVTYPGDLALAAAILGAQGDE
ncbi:MAG TPA: 2-C-methyl-D-erythritol 4-phosphate cytidylyltransferase [Casimicrobiaceae bacterium]|nr:2-C-methyl-D-erythritol 4-phosphate cytidylyltransferase [Casimicrobiaceae bacterium]